MSNYQIAMPDNKPIYVCNRCGKCCRWPGYVRMTEEEINAAANFLNLPIEEFIEQYTAVTDDRRGLTLIEHDDGRCILLSDDDRCLINPVKPRQCRDFPNTWNFPGFEKICQATPADTPERT